MRPADVWGCCRYPRSSSSASVFRIVAEDTPRPATCINRAEPTGSPVSMYSATSAARICAALGESCDMVSSLLARVLRAIIHAIPAHRDRGQLGILYLPAAHRDELGHDGDGDLFRTHRADV